MGQTLLKLPVMSIERREILTAYAEIDTYSQAKHPSKPLAAGKTARKMGKNDIWIAATAHVAGPTFHLVTSDHDFDHLNGTFINLIKF
jgi:tRNA(fMet)-specific endonuclease VapC